MEMLELWVKGELWARYPRGMRFPRAFRQCYPLRGGGLVSKILYILNRLSLDRLLLKKSFVDSKHSADVAFFYPAKSRSDGRYYAYRIKSNCIESYVKFAISSTEKMALHKEVRNNFVAIRICRDFVRVPRCIEYVEGDNGVSWARFEPLPENAGPLPDEQDWIDKINEISKAIRSAGFIHGDFAWHNFKVSGRQLWLLDWEELHKIDDEHPALVDEISFWAAFEFYNRKRSLNSVWGDFKNRYFTDYKTKNIAVKSIELMANRRTAMGLELMGFYKKEYQR